MPRGLFFMSACAGRKELWRWHGRSGMEGVGKYGKYGGMEGMDGIWCKDTTFL